MIASVPLKYAQALADVAGEVQQEDQVQEELLVFAELLKSNQELMEALTHPGDSFFRKGENRPGISQEDSAHSDCGQFHSGPY